MPNCKSNQTISLPQVTTKCLSFLTNAANPENQVIQRTSALLVGYSIHLPHIRAPSLNCPRLGLWGKVSLFKLSFCLFVYWIGDQLTVSNISNIFTFNSVSHWLSLNKEEDGAGNTCDEDECSAQLLLNVQAWMVKSYKWMGMGWWKSLY